MSSATPNRVQSAQWQTAHALDTNAASFVSHHGINHCAFLTLTFPEPMYPTPAKEKLSKALPILAEYFHDYIWTMGLGTNNRRIHYHILVASHHDLRDGIDITLYRQLLNPADDAFGPHRSAAEKRQALQRLLSNNPALKQLRRDLHPRLHKLGFGHQVDLGPIYSDGPRIADYMKVNYLDTVRRKNLLFRGIRLTGYKTGGHRVLRPPFGWVGDRSRQRRHSLAIVARALGVTEYTSMKTVFGSKWGYLSSLMLLNLESEHGSNPDGWSSAEIRRLALEEGMMPFLPVST